MSTLDRLQVRRAATAATIESLKTQLELIDEMIVEEQVARAKQREAFEECVS